MHFGLFKKIALFVSLLAFAWAAKPAAVFAACNFHNVTGYVWSRTTGWVSLNCSNHAGSIDYGLGIDFESGDPEEPVTGYAWSSGLGWLNMQPAGPYPSWKNTPATGATFHRNAGESPTTTAGVIKGWAKWEALGDNGWMVMGPIKLTGTEYGVEIGSDRLFSGWSWNGGDDLDADPEPERGDGWVMWDSEDSGGGAAVIAHWFETLYGDIYSGGSISAPFAPPSSRYNATYLIQANGTIEPVSIQSGSGDSVPYISESFDSLSLADEANNYLGTLGWLDKAGMIAGRYGTPESSLPAGSNISLDGKVYHYTGNLTLNQALTFKKGVASAKGSGTVVVDGDLTINKDLSYQSGAVGTNINQVPSVAWIVKGDITIDETVENLVGVFYSEGTIATGTTGSNETDVPLVVEGMFIANQINLQRVFSDETQEPAEQITFDGRAIVNPPPGLTDMAKGLPILREARP